MNGSTHSSSRLVTTQPNKGWANRKANANAKSEWELAQGCREGSDGNQWEDCLILRSGVGDGSKTQLDCDIGTTFEAVGLPVDGSENAVTGRMITCYCAFLFSLPEQSATNLATYDGIVESHCSPSTPSATTRVQWAYIHSSSDWHSAWQDNRLFNV
ncbi:hypothetical protein EI94DRAFT_1706666 [Lactarius quietus]|nr:hypothetical protein EI94DRAFT_1706666 [Lactarius quietus]